MQNLNDKKFTGFDPEDSQTGFVAATALGIALVTAMAMLIVAGAKGAIDYFLF